MAPRSKGGISLAELDRLRAAGVVRFGTVLADACYGASAAFRRGLDTRNQRWAVDILHNQKVYGTGVRPVPAGGRARKPVPDAEPCAAEAILAALAWQGVPWQHGTMIGSTGHPSPQARGSTGICQARRPGWLASGARAASANTTSAT